MTQVNVEKLIKEKADVDKSQSFREKLHEKQLERDIIGSNKKGKIKITLPKMPQMPAPLLKERIMEMREQKEEEKDVRNSFKEGVFKLASMPIRADKRDDLYTRIKGSAFLNRYVEDNVYISYIDKINNDMKAVACYGYHYISALKSK